MRKVMNKIYKTIAPDIDGARRKANLEVQNRRSIVKKLVEQPFKDIDEALKVKIDNGKLPSGRSGYVSPRHFRRQRRYTEEQASKIMRMR